MNDFTDDAIEGLTEHMTNLRHCLKDQEDSHLSIDKRSARLLRLEIMKWCLMLGYELPSKQVNS